MTYITSWFKLNKNQEKIHKLYEESQWDQEKWKVYWLNIEKKRIEIIHSKAKCKNIIEKSLLTDFLSH